MNSIELEKKDKTFFAIIAALSLSVAILVAILFYIPLKGTMQVKLLPTLNAILNTGTALALISGYIFIKKGKTELHRKSMLMAFSLSTIFLLSYVLYHANNKSVEFPKTNPIKWVYYFILFTHIILSATVVPLVLTSLYFALSKQIDRHKKIVKYTFPIWLYVSVTGVIVYLMISPYYK